MQNLFTSNTSKYLKISFSALAVGIATLPTQIANAQTFERVSIADDGTQANQISIHPSISGDGQQITFRSFATTLVPNDTNNKADIFVYDRTTSSIERVTKSDAGVQANEVSDRPIISEDGRYVVFHSLANNLIPNDTNGQYDVFIFDRDNDTIERVSEDANGTGGNNTASLPHISADGRYVSYASTATNFVTGDTNNRQDVYLLDRDTGIHEIISVATDGTQGNGHSTAPYMSSDGRYVSFVSSASNLIAADTNNTADVFVRDRVAGTTERVSISSTGVETNNSSTSPSISSDGRFVEFSSHANNLVANDTNNQQDEFIHDRDTGQTQRVSVTDNGVEGNSASILGFISADGNHVVFQSWASNFVSGDTNNNPDIFVVNRALGTIQKVSQAPDGSQLLSYSQYPTISADGGAVAFLSGANNLVSGDTNNQADIFVTSVAPLNEPPIAYAGVDQAIRAGDVVMLDGTGSSDDNTDTASLDYAWNISTLPAGSTAVLDDATSSSPSFVADIAGTYILSLVVTDEGGLASPADDVEISSDNLAPTAVAGDDLLIILGESAVLDGSASSDPENDPLSFSWSLSNTPAGSTALVADNTQSTAGFTPDVEGSYTVELSVNDALGAGAPDTLEITATSAESYAESQIMCAADIVASLGTNGVTNKGNKTAFGNFLRQAITAIDEGETDEAISKLNKAIERTDGCPLNGSPDGNGSGRDWITSCAAQEPVYTCLVNARDALLTP